MKVTRHILRTSNGLELEVFFNEENGELCGRSRCASKPSTEEIKRDLLELLQWAQEITDEWSRRTGMEVTVISGCGNGITCAFHSKS